MVSVPGRNFVWCFLHKGDVTWNDSQRRFLIQRCNIVATLFHCFVWRKKLTLTFSNLNFSYRSVNIAVYELRCLVSWAWLMDPKTTFLTGLIRWKFLNLFQNNWFFLLQKNKRKYSTYGTPIESPWLPRLPCAGLREVQISKQPIKSPLTTEGKFSSFIPRVDPLCDSPSPPLLNL